MIDVWKKHSRIIKVAALLWLIVVGLGTIVRTGMLRDQKPFIEMAVYAGILVFIFTRPTIASFARSVPRPHRALMIVFFVIFFTGQFVQNLRLTYPFTPWAMYSRPETAQEITYYRYRGYDLAAAPVDLSPEKIVPSNDKHVVTTKLKNLIRDAYYPRDDWEQELSQQRLEQFLVAIGNIYNGRHADAPLRSIEVFEYTWQFRTEDRHDLVPRSLVRVQIPEGPDQ